MGIRSKVSKYGSKLKKKIKKSKKEDNLETIVEKEKKARRKSAKLYVYSDLVDKNYNSSALASDSSSGGLSYKYFYYDNKTNTESSPRDSAVALGASIILDYPISEYKMNLINGIRRPRFSFKKNSQTYNKYENRSKLSVSEFKDLQGAYKEHSL